MYKCKKEKSFWKEEFIFENESRVTEKLIQRMNKKFTVLRVKNGVRRIFCTKLLEWINKNRFEVIVTLFDDEQKLDEANISPSYRIAAIN